MKKTSVKFLLLVFCATSFIYSSGCGEKKSILKDDNNVTSKSTVTSSKADNIINSQSEEVLSDSIDPTVGEGAIAMDAWDLSSARREELGSSFQVEKYTNVMYEVSINSVQYTEERDMHSESPDYVLLVNYSYKNYQNELLLLGDMKFQLQNADGTIVFPAYYYPELKAAETVENGGECSAQVAFSINEKVSEYALAYYDQKYPETSMVRIDFEI